MTKPAKYFCGPCGCALRVADKAAHALDSAEEHAKFGVACPACNQGIDPWGRECADCSGTALVSNLAAGAIRQRLNAEKAYWGEAAN